MPFDESLSDERTEQPTARHREEAQREGRVAQSHDLTAAVILLGGLGGFVMGGSAFMNAALELFREGFDVRPHDLTVDGTLALLATSALAAARLAGPLLVAPLLAAVAATLLQTRFALAPKAATFQWKRLAPRQGFARLLGGHGAVEALKALVKVTVVGGLAFVTFRAEWPTLLVVPTGAYAASLEAVGGVVSRVWLHAGAAYLLLGGLDYGWQWWRHEKSLRMSKEQVRQESRESDGDPQLRGRVRAVHKRMASRRMVAEVRRADVVLRNPTHYAVALRYESGRMRAPRVVAKGERLTAVRIVEIARRHGVPTVENPPLTRALYHAVPVGRDVPHEFYRAVADVLAHVYALRQGAR
jgi:flagellar biosynthetic protein FlhB